MPTSAAVTAVRSAVAALNSGDIDGYLGHFDPASPRWIPGGDQPLSLTDIGENLRQMQAGFDGLRLHEELLFGDEIHACAQWRLVGRHVRECYGVPPSGRTVDVPTCEVYEVTAGVVTSTWVYGNPAILFDQIGVGPGAAG